MLYTYTEGYKKDDHWNNFSTRCTLWRGDSFLVFLFFNLKLTMFGHNSICFTFTAVFGAKCYDEFIWNTI